MRNPDIAPTVRNENGLHPVTSLVTTEFLEALGVAVYTTDEAGIITAFNEAAADLWGRRPELGKDQWCGFWRLYFADGRPMAHDECPMGITLKENRAVRGVEAIAEKPDGTRVWFVPYPTPLHDADGGLVGAVNVLIDVTERKRAEAAASHLEAIVVSSDDAIVSKNLEGIIASWNDGARRLFGFSEEEVVGKSIRMIIPDDRQAEEDEVLARIRRGDRVEHFETVRRRKDGTEVPISLTVSPVKDRNGTIVGASKVARDITERKEAERAIAEALAVKDEFIGLVSHELRTPLTTILGNAAILARRESALDAEERLAAAADVYEDARRLDGIIEDLLALARSDNGTIEGEPLPLVKVLEQSVMEFRLGSGRHVEVLADVPAVTVSGDGGLIGQVIGNYLSNAEKYSPKDSLIEVHVDVADGHGQVRVLDRGIGIDPSEAAKLFDSFYRSKNVGRVGGVGIGLSVCRRIATAMGGKCWAAPRNGGGSEFGFSLPLAASSEAGG